MHWTHPCARPTNTAPIRRPPPNTGNATRQDSPRCVVIVCARERDIMPLPLAAVSLLVPQRCHRIEFRRPHGRHHPKDDTGDGTGTQRCNNG